jgi:hypothetical protein
MVILSACSDGAQRNEWYFYKIHINKIWELVPTKGETQTIAFIDTGISEDVGKKYATRIVDMYNSIDGSHNVKDDHGHGTQMIGIASGVAPNSKIVVIKAISSTGRVYPESVLLAIRYAINKHVDIINLSFGSYNSNSEIEKQIKIALQNGISVLASSGDYRNKDILFPASLEGVISVAAKDKKGRMWYKSNTSSKLITAFPGVGIRSFDRSGNPNKTTLVNGTSQATAIASGYLALLRDYYARNNVQVDNDEILFRIKKINAVKSDHPNYLLPFNLK